MNYIGKVITNFRDFYNEINSATLTGAIDVVVVKQPDGTYVCSPFHVRFGKLGVLRSREKVVDIEINGEVVDIHMKLGESGEAFFVEEVEEELKVPSHLATSPIPLAPDIGEELRKLRERNDSEEGPVSNTVIQSEIISDRTNLQININNASIEAEHISDVIINNGESDILCNGKVSSSPEDIPIKDLISVKSMLTEDRTVSLQNEESSVPLNLIYDNYTHSTLADQEDTGSKKKRKRINKKKRARSRELTSSVPSRTEFISRDSVPLNSIYSSSLKQENQVRFASDEPEDIFQMDDFKDNNEDDEGFLSSGLSRSISLPVHGNEKLHDDNDWLSRKLSITYIGEFHPFSDGDVTPLSSPTGSRPPSPKSDTEYEINKTDSKHHLDTDEVSWGWGELPSRLPEKKLSVCKSEPLSSDDEDLANKSEANVKEKRSMLGGMLNLMRSTKKLRHMPESEGIYLDQLNPDELDPEIAALYFPKFRSNYPENYTNRPLHDEDTESGNGSSLPHSPHSVEGAIGGGHSIESDNEERQSIFDYCSKFYSDIAISLCGGLQDYEGELPSDHFLNSLICFDEYAENPSVLQNPSLVIRLAGKYYNWQTAAPMLLSLVTYQKPLPENTTKQLINEHMPKKKKPKAYSWWNWRRNTVTSETEVDAIKKTETESPVEKPQPSENQVEPVIDKSEPVNIPVTDAVEVTAEAVTVTEVLEPLAIAEAAPVPETIDHPEVLPKMPTVESIKYDTDGYSPSDTDPETSTASSEKIIGCEKYMKSLRLSSKQLECLKLKDGPNEVVFSVTTAYQGTTRCTCSIFLWSYDDKIVISDIDGTITKSDVLGHILPIIGKDWAQLGVAKLFTKIRSNGYQFLYLSARAIGQAQVTREYLRSVKQGDLCLPDGPLLLSPTSLLNAFHREVIKKKPEEFKISCLKDIQALFPGCTNPFCSGFGNKINDIWAYRAVSIPLSRIFTINHRGELKLENIQNFQSSYNCLSDIVDHIYPPLQRQYISDGQLTTNFTSPEEFSFFTFWRDPLPILNEDDQLFKYTEK